MGVPQEVKREYLLKAVEKARLPEDRSAVNLGQDALGMFERDGNRLPGVLTALLIIREVLAFSEQLPGSARELRRMSREGVVRREWEITDTVPPFPVKRYYPASE